MIQGPPGTGKTKTLAAIVAFMALHSADSILVCSQQNETADLLYQALDQYDFLKEIILRIYSRSKVELMKKEDAPFLPNSFNLIREDLEDEKGAKLNY